MNRTAWLIGLGLILYILAVAAFDAAADPATYSRIFLKSGADVQEIGTVTREAGEMEGNYIITLPVDVEGGTIEFGVFYICTVAGNECGESAMTCTDVPAGKCPDKTEITAKEGPGPHHFRWSYDGHVTPDACDDQAMTWPPFVIRNEQPSTPIFPGCMRVVEP